MYVHHMKSYHGSLLTLVTRENIIILMDSGALEKKLK